jgi:exopolyphosphatase / guanosine-5'-triphosphate,3'-diphosphate pyrophosphatase
LRIAILDLGTNTFHLLIVSVGKKGDVRKLFKSKITVKLGEGAIHRNRIAEEPFRRGIGALRHYAGIIAGYKPGKVFAFATSAIRGAKNGGEFVDTVREETGIGIRVISGDEEAELITWGVRGCVDLDPGPSLIMDIGGGSTEFILADNENIFWKRSFDIGAARMLEMFTPSDPVTPEEIVRMEAWLDERLTPLADAMKRFPAVRLVGSSGSFDTFADMIGYRFHRRSLIRNVKTYRYDLKEFFRMHEIIIRSTTAQRKKMKGLVKMRVDMIVLSSICTNYVLTKFGIDEMMLSKYALKEGALFRLLDDLAHK